MNYYGRRRRYYSGRSRYSRSSGRVSRYSSSSTKRAVGNYRAALQQRDQSSVNLSIPTYISVSTQDIAIHNPFYASGSQNVTISNGGCVAINVFDLLRKSTFFQSYANMYDQIKLDRIRIKLTPSSFELGGSLSKYSSYTVVTAWDRSGISNEQLSINTDHRYDKVFGSDTSVDTKAKGVYLNLTADDIATYSSAITKPVSSGTNNSITRTIYPRTTQEKGLYINTADIDQWYLGVGEKGNWYGVSNQFATQSNFVTVQDTQGNQGPVPVYDTISVLNSNAVARNPCFIGESPTIPWKPTLLVGLLNKPGSIESEDGTQTIIPKMSLYVEADIGVSFRGLRKAPVVS